MSILLVLSLTQKTLSVHRPQPRPRLAGERQSHEVLHAVLTGPQPRVPSGIQQPVRIQVEEKGQDGGSCLT